MDSRKRMLRHDLLSDEASARLAKAWQDDGDADALWELVSGHMRLARLMSRNVRTFVAQDEDDLLQEAVLILLKAATSYDPERAGPFRNWAATKLRLHLGKKVRRERKIETREACYSDPLAAAGEFDSASDPGQAYSVLVETIERARAERPRMVDDLTVRIFLLKARGADNAVITEELGVHRNTVAKRMLKLKKALAELGIGDLDAD